LSDLKLSAEQILASVEAGISAVPFPVCIYDQDDRLLLCSAQFRESVGAIFEGRTGHVYEHDLKYEDIVRTQVSERYAPDQVDVRIASELERHRIEGTVSVDMNIEGSWMRRSRTLSPEGSLVAMAMPIDELVQRTRALVDAKQEMEHQALHDPLTDLPNRRALNAYLQRVLDSDLLSEDVVVFHVDLDKFKLVNDTLGHDAGDCVLLEASRILRAEVRSTDFVARVGGDEFVMVFTSLKDRDAIAGMAQRIVDKMREPIYYDDQCCQIGASIGVVVREEFATAERLVMDADIALYEAKSAGRGRYAFFQSSARVKHSVFKKRIFEVREAIMLNAFEPFFQPQICARSGDIVGFEALARWQDREVGTRPPSDFLEALDEANLCAELDEMILKKTLRRMADWNEEGVDIPKVSVNLSPASLARGDLSDHLKWLCDAAGIEPDRLVFEILEDVVLDTQGGAIAENVGRLKKAGFAVALDDFGTGSTSISSLRYLQPDRIKIAREFVKDIDQDDELQIITSALIALVQNLGMEVLCEGVETFEELALLRGLGSDCFQGFLFAKPMCSDEVPIWISDYQEEQQPILKSA